MKNQILSLFVAITLMSGSGWAATSCSRANLTSCLDSVCAINISSNPAARCQYCGTASAGAPSATGMRSVSVGVSAKYNVSANDLKKAPEEPAARYSWAAQQCLKKVVGCTTDDVADVYDPLIEQSCRAAGVVAEIKSLSAALGKRSTQESCRASIESCMMTDNRCGGDFSSCKSDADFDRHFASCAVQASGCDEYTADIRGGLVVVRNSVFENADKVIENIVASYTNARANLFIDAQNQCADNSARNACIAQVCATNMVNKCAAGFESERALATQMCAFYDVACAALR